ncbi:twin-arginine translocase subunit TatC [Yinghuangia aomiensis]
MLILLNFGGVITAKNMIAWWRWVVMGIFVFGAVATPTTDPLTMCLLSVPISVLYGLAILVAAINDKRRAADAAPKCSAATWTTTRRPRSTSRPRGSRTPRASTAPPRSSGTVKRDSVHADDIT